MRDIERYFTYVVGDDGTRPTKAHVIDRALRLLGGAAPFRGGDDRGQEL